MGKVCVCGAGALQIDYDSQDRSPSAGQTFKEGDFLSIDGTAGNVYAGQLTTAAVRNHPGARRDDRSSRARRAETFKNLRQLMNWCSKVTKLQVRTNADTPEQAATPSRSAPRASA